MILSNEPGYYKAGEYGIRIENLVLVEEREIAGAEGEFLGFETLTLVPIDRALVERATADRRRDRVVERLSRQGARGARAAARGRRCWPGWRRSARPCEARLCSL